MKIKLVTTEVNSLNSYTTLYVYARKRKEKYNLFDFNEIVNWELRGYVLSKRQISDCNDYKRAIYLLKVNKRFVKGRVIHQKEKYKSVIKFKII